MRRVVPVFADELPPPALVNSGSAPIRLHSAMKSAVGVVMGASALRMKRFIQE